HLSKEKGMRKGLLGVIVGVGMMIAQSASAADMVRYDKSASNVQPEQTVAQVQMNPDCAGQRCRPCANPCAKQCPPKQCPPRRHRHHHHKKHHQHHHNHKHGAKKHHANKAQKSGHNESVEEKKMSSERNHSSARKTASKAKNTNAYVEEYIDDVGREHR
ncbi:MAG TPA: hypothetical protein PLD88_02355, partial [Candidatus Berkiella sp.]|nr:hypothetical protein [Candidatus Berkiella sp.]